MTKTASMLALIVTAISSMPAHAQSRVFVSGLGLDTNPCAVTQPCRTFQVAYNKVPANGEIEVLDPAGYGPLTITHGISIQAHGWASISDGASCPACSAITVSVTTTDQVTLNGLVVDGLGTGQSGIKITSGPSVQILNSVVRHFRFGINATNGTNLLVEDTIASDNNIGINLPVNSVNATLNRITANDNQVGVNIGGGSTAVTVANSVVSNNAGTGLSSGGGAVAWLAKTVISGSPTGVQTSGGTVKSYGDNYLNDNGTPVLGSLTPVGMQ
jgi:Right handed beta helix region